MGFIRLLAAIATFCFATSASATTITYSFTAGGPGSYIHDGSLTYDWQKQSEPNNGYTYSPTWGVTYDNHASVTFSFSIDASRYQDEFPEIGYATSQYSNPATLPWVTSQLTATTSVLNASLATNGTYSSYFQASSYAGLGIPGNNDFLSVVDFGLNSPTTTTYVQGGYVHQAKSLSNVLNLEVSQILFDVIDGQELPVSFTGFQKGFVQLNLWDYYGFYDEGSGWPYLSKEIVDSYSIWAPITGFSITRSDNPQQVPEPTSIALVALSLAALGFTGISTCRRRRQ